MNDSDLALDGNALGGVLREIFVEEVTDARGRCDSCGAEAHIGEVVVYAYSHAPGTVGLLRVCDERPCSQKACQTEEFPSSHGSPHW